MSDVNVDVAVVSRRAAPTGVWPVHRARVALATGAILVVSAVIVAVAATVPTGPAPAAVSFVLGVVLVPLLASPLEWLVHRCVYHVPVLAALRPIHKVHTAHHVTYFPTWRYVTEGPPRRLAISSGAPEVHTSRWANTRVRAAHFIWYMGIGSVAIWLPAWFLTGNVAFLAGIVVSSAVVSNLFIAVHDTIHRPGSHRIIEAQPWYAFLDRHHYVHHVDLGANLNFLLPLADWLYGTLRTELTPDEIAVHGSLADAKALPVGQGGRARQEARRASSAAGDAGVGPSARTPRPS